MDTYTLNIGGQLVSLERPLVMGILNATPDSFLESSRMECAAKAAARAAAIVHEGGSIIDIGGCSTRPGSTPASEEEELARLLPAVGAVKEACPEAMLSIDTFRPDVVRRCHDAFGPFIINDISGGNEEMYRTASELHLPYVLTYNNPQPRFDNVVVDCMYFMAERTARMHDLGVCDIIADPGFGFSKTQEQNYELLATMERLHELTMPLMAGLSRKSMIYRLLGITPEEAQNGTTVLNTIALEKGVHILRVHDVRQAVEAIVLTSNLKPQPTNPIQCFSRSR